MGLWVYGVGLRGREAVWFSHEVGLGLWVASVGGGLGGIHWDWSKR